MTEAEFLAIDAVLEYACVLNGEAAALIAAASSGQSAEIEARLWTCRRILTAAIEAWREAAPRDAE